MRQVRAGEVGFHRGHSSPGAAVGDQSARRELSLHPVLAGLRRRVIGRRLHFSLSGFGRCAIGARSLHFGLSGLGRRIAVGVVAAAVIGVGADGALARDH